MRWRARVPPERGVLRVPVYMRGTGGSWRAQRRRGWCACERNPASAPREGGMPCGVSRGRRPAGKIMRATRNRAHAENGRGTRYAASPSCRRPRCRSQGAGLRGDPVTPRPEANPELSRSGSRERPMPSHRASEPGKRHAVGRSAFARFRPGSPRTCRSHRTLRGARLSGSRGRSGWDAVRSSRRAGGGVRSSTRRRGSWPR